MADDAVVCGWVELGTPMTHHMWQYQYHTTLQLGDFSLFEFAWERREAYFWRQEDSLRRAGLVASNQPDDVGSILIGLTTSPIDTRATMQYRREEGNAQQDGPQLEGQEGHAKEVHSKIGHKGKTDTGNNGKKGGQGEEGNAQQDGQGKKGTTDDVSANGTLQTDDGKARRARRARRGGQGKGNNGKGKKGTTDDVSANGTLQTGKGKGAWR